MPKTFEVTVPANRDVQFPDRCLVCGKPSPGETVRVRADMSWSVDYIRWVSGGLPYVSAPVHAGCRGVLRFSRISRPLILILLGLIGGGLGIVFGWNAWITLAAAAVLIAPAALWQIAHPTYFQYERDGKQLKMSFRDGEIAEEFASLNGGEFEVFNESKDAPRARLFKVECASCGEGLQGAAGKTIICPVCGEETVVAATSPKVTG